jgi:hypothetical protein
VDRLGPSVLKVVPADWHGEWFTPDALASASAGLDEKLRDRELHRQLATTGKSYAACVAPGRATGSEQRHP